MGVGGGRVSSGKPVGHWLQPPRNQDYFHLKQTSSGAERYKPGLCGENTMYTAADDGKDR